MGALLALADEHSASLIECQRPELGLRKLLESKLEQLKDKPENQVRYETVIFYSPFCLIFLFYFYHL